MKNIYRAALLISFIGMVVCFGAAKVLSMNWNQEQNQQFLSFILKTEKDLKLSRSDAGELKESGYTEVARSNSKDLNYDLSGVERLEISSTEGGITLGESKTDAMTVELPASLPIPDNLQCQVVIYRKNEVLKLRKLQGDIPCSSYVNLTLPARVQLKIAAGKGNLEIFTNTSKLKVELGMGDVKLYKIQETASLADYSIEVGMGSIQVLLMKDKEANVTLHTGMGSASYSGVNNNPDAKLALKADVGLGDISVKNDR